MPDETSNRRDFLKGRAIADGVRRTGDALADSIIGHTKATAPDARDTLRLTQRAMASDFSVIMNAGEHESIWAASRALELTSSLDEQLSVYKPESEVSRLNRSAHEAPQVVEPRLFALIRLACDIAHQTDGAFDLTTDPLIRLWRDCRAQTRPPTQDEIDQRMSDVGMRFVVLGEGQDDREHHEERPPNGLKKTVSFLRPGTSINFGAIGKGYALDREAEQLTESDGMVDGDFLLHGGQSSILARGRHTGCDGWPVGIGNPLFTDRRLGTILLQDQAMATSGSNIQYYRVGDRRYGHIVDPRTGWPVDRTLSVTAVTDTAARADALSTAFYVMKVEEIEAYCRRHSNVGAIVIPVPQGDRRVQPRVFGIDPQQIYWDADQIVVPDRA